MRRALLCSIMFAALANSAQAEPPDSIFGVYTRLSKTCGGPGSADGPVNCNRVVEDRFEIGQHVSLEPRSPETVYVSFGLHQMHSDLCLFGGYGVWKDGTIVLEQSENPVRSACRVTVAVSSDSVRLSDPGDKCRPTYCVGNIRLHDISYSRRTQNQK